MLVLCLGLILQIEPFVYESAYDVSVGPLPRQLKLLSISDIIAQEAPSMVYKALNAEAPLYLTEQFTRVSTITNRTLRGSNLSLRPPRLKSTHGQNCSACRGSSVWNSLPIGIKSSRTFGSFQKKLKAMLREKTRKTILASCFSHAFALLNVILLCKIYLVVHIHIPL